MKSTNNNNHTKNKDAKKSNASHSQVTTAEARKRLLRDLKELHDNPLENVNAAPVDDQDLFLWHANLRGSDPQMKETFHLILSFPSNYPLSPPRVELCTPLPHPNVIPERGTYSLCMDMLEQGEWAEDANKKMKYNGWSSAYSVQLILVQLQSFLLDIKHQVSTRNTSLALALDTAKRFSCKTCPHKPSSPFPAFPTPQQLEAKRCVRIVKFVPHIRPQHMYNSVRRYKPRVATIATKKQPSTNEETLQKTISTTSVEISTGNQGKETLGERKEQVNGWVVVKSKNKGTSSEEVTKKKKRTGRKKSKKPKTKVSEETKGEETPKKGKDYVQIMLRDAEERERKLAERRKAEAEEIKEENKRLKKANTSAQPTKTSQSTKPTQQPTPAMPQKQPKLTQIPTTGQNTQNKKAVIHKKRRSNSSKRFLANTPQTSTSTQATSEEATVTTILSTTAQPTTIQSSTAQSTADQSTAQSTTWQASGKKLEASTVMTFKELECASRPDHTKLGNLASLPHDSLLQTLSHLSLSEVGDLALVSKDMNKIAEDGRLWRELFSRYYPKSRLTAKNIYEWKLVFHREVDHILDDLTCFHTKLNFEEDILGVPISFTVNPITGKADYIYSPLDYMSSTAFNKLKIRKSPYKEVFTHFLPLYITEDHFQKAFPDIKRVLVQLSPEYRSSGFDPKMALSVFGKLMNTMIVLVMNEGIAASTKALNGYIAFHRLLLAFVEKYPQLMYEVNHSIEEFIRSEEGRVKSVIPSLGDWVALLSVSNKYTWRHVAKPLIAEAFDRNVLFICKENPTLATLANISDTDTPGVEWSRINESFEHSLVSIKLLLFHSYFLTCIARPAGTSLAQVADNYDRYFGHPSSKTLDSFQNAVKRIQKMKGWPDFYALAGLPCPSPTAMTQILRECVRNSKKKRYHNNFTNFRNVQASGTSVILNRGDNYVPPKDLDKVEMKLGWGYQDKDWYLLDASVFEFDSDGKFIDPYIDWNHKSNANNSITHSGDILDHEKMTVTQTIRITLHEVPQVTHFIVFSITAFKFDLSRSTLPWIRMINELTGDELCQYALEQTSTRTAVVMCALQRHPIKGGWSLKVYGELDDGRSWTKYQPMLKNIPSILQK
eukprot:Phypoly_transcript_01295.p1 GENE.Phypoly_transcript_01295~~Phypoly_transcript_01295.p1  ORF type:complete len:1116 (+),score=191.20 Phypoly_transcript_01295:80-3427(+)